MCVFKCVKCTSRWGVPYGFVISGDHGQRGRMEHWRIWSVSTLGELASTRWTWEMEEFFDDVDLPAYVLARLRLGRTACCFSSSPCAWRDIRKTVVRVEEGYNFQIIYKRFNVVLVTDPVMCWNGSQYEREKGMLRSLGDWGVSNDGPVCYVWVRATMCYNYP